MKAPTLVTPPLFLLIAAFTYLFFHWTLGINVFIFDGALLLLLLRIRPELARRASFRWAVAGLLAAAISIVAVHSTTSMLAHAASLLLLVGVAQERELRFVWYALTLGVLSLFAGPLRLLDRRHENTQRRSRRLSVFRWLQQGALPVVVLMPFLILYSAGSDRFSKVIERVGAGLGELLGATSLPHFLAVGLVGALLVLPLFLPGNELDLAGKDAALSDQLLRQRMPRKKRFRPTALLGEYRRGILTLLLLNGLIMVNNLTDLQFVWLDTAVLSPAVLSQYVHEGTYSLLLSILLAMLVVLFYFRGNLNFYRKNSLLRRLTYLWLAQNAFLALSVGVRNGHYVAEYGLAYGRIQIAFVLLLILVGLFTLYRKVRYTLTLSFLFQANGLALWLFLIAFGAVNWPGVITRVNLTQARSEIDWDYLIHELDERNLFLLEGETGPLPSKQAWGINSKARRAKQAMQDANWRSWNYPDWRNRMIVED